MNEFLRSFIMTGIRDMIDRNVALYQTYQYASGWFSKGVLNQEDLEEIERLYEEKAKQEEIIEEVVEDIVIEEPVEEPIETPVEQLESDVNSSEETPAEEEIIEEVVPEDSEV